MLYICTIKSTTNMATKGNASATKSGQRFEAKIKSQDIEFFNELLGITDINDIEDIDSKTNKGEDLRIKLTNLFLESNAAIPYIRTASSLRGDLLNKSSNVINDVKNYDKIQSKFHFPKKSALIQDFIKSIDSNIKYALFYKLPNFYHEDLQKLSDFYFLDKTNTSWYNSMIQKYNTPTTICKITKDKFVDLFLFMELGYSWDIQGVLPKKGFISQVGDAIQYKEVDPNKSLDDSEITVKLTFDEKGYVHIYFYQNDVCLYIMSQRGDCSANCSFINRCLFEIKSNVKMK